MTNYVSKIDLSRQSLISVIDEVDLPGLMENNTTIIFISAIGGFLKIATKIQDNVTVTDINGSINGKSIPEFPNPPLTGETLAIGAVMYNGAYAIRWVTVTGATITVPPIL